MQKVIGISIIILLMIGGCSQQKEGRQHEKKTGNAKDEGEMVDNKKKKTDGLVVVMETSMGSIEIELNENKAPVTVKNFLSYVTSGTYDGTIFHRVIDGFMIQGGGFTPDGNKKPTNPPIELESNNGLTNNLGTVAMARTNIPDSATNQFFINVKDNSFLNYSSISPGYAVFGKVVSGMDIVKQIKKVKTGTRGGTKDWPVDDVLIKKVFLKK
jgi:cyclophilin family peptidyl-prolyl cis-trans isomerase